MKYSLAAFGFIGAMALAAALPADAAVTSSVTQPTMKPMPERVTSIPPQHSVALMQEALNSEGAHLHVDGVWGLHTEAALRTYQRRNGLQVTGHFDTATRHMLNPIG